MMQRRQKIAVLYIGLALFNASCASRQAGRGAGRSVENEYSHDVEARIERVTRGLLPETELSMRFGPASTLVERMLYHHTPGVSIAVINDGKVEWARGFGVQEIGTTRAVTAETMFQAASISKAVTALGAMQLVAAGKIDLDEDVNHRLVSWKVPPRGEWQPRVTLRQLLSHSAGLTAHGFYGYQTTEAIPTVVQILDAIPPANSDPVRVNVLPGTMFRYSGGGITVVQLMLTDLLRRPFPDIMDEAVLRPLGMTQSTYAQPPAAARQGSAATAHPKKGVALRGNWHIYPEMAAAGLWTTPSDLAKVGIAVWRALKGESGPLSRDLAEQMVTPQIPIGSPESGTSMGIGFMLEGKGASVRFGHSGSNEGFVSLATFYKGVGKGAVIMMNSNEGSPMLAEIERAIAREYDWPDYFPKERTAKAAQIAALEAMIGEYRTEKGLRLVVDQKQGRLRLAVGDQPPVELSPQGETTFFIPNLNGEVEFRKGEGQGMEHLILRQEGNSLEAKRR
jgi:CubicO group peptidase (beta-lactamase class C family)